MFEKKILYIFGSGRINRLNSETSNFEFFYGYNFFQKKYPDLLQAIEMLPNSEIGNRRLLSIFDRVLNKFLKLPFYSQLILTYKNYKIAKNSDIILCTNDRIALSIMPITLMLSNKKVFVIVMGLFANKKHNFLVNSFQEIIIKILMKNTEKFIFLGNGELDEAISRFPKYKNKFEFLPFAVDSNFWQMKSKNKKEIDLLFVGNDGNRDFKFLYELAINLKNFNLTIISSEFNYDTSNLPNVTVIKGNWNKNFLTDETIRDFYQRSTLTLIPLKPSLQPSGQSVALQSISSGTPILITETEGFWDKKKFLDNEHLFFMKNNTVDLWFDKITTLLNNKQLLEQVSKQGQKLVNESYNIDEFNNKLFNIIAYE